MSQDRDSIVELIAEYLWALDALDWDRFQALLLPEVIHTSGSGVRNGREALIGYLRPGRENLDATQHLVTNFVVVQHGDHADVRCLLQAHHIKGGALFSAGSTYRVKAERTGSTWLIARIDTTTTWTAGDPAVVGG